MLRIIKSIQVLENFGKNEKLFCSSLKPINLIYKRNFFYWLYVVFNSVDENRIKEVGPDQACSEWIIRNGGGVRWSGEKEFSRNYNHTPLKKQNYFIEEIDATEASLTHHGFLHLKNCKMIKNIILHKCGYLEDKALSRLNLVSDSLGHLQISDCRFITSNGLEYLADLKNLSTLLIFDLPKVKDKDVVLKKLKNALPTCDIQYLENK